LTKAHRFNPSSATEKSNHRVLGIHRHNLHVVGERNVGLGGRVLKKQTSQSTSSKVALIIDFLMVFLHGRGKNHTQVRCGILVERCSELETKHRSKAEMNLHA
jgi:hypothetical protein